MSHARDARARGGPAQDHTLLLSAAMVGFLGALATIGFRESIRRWSG